MTSARYIAALKALCGLQLHPQVLVPAVLEALHHVVPSYRNLFDWTDEHGRLVRYFIEGPIDVVLARRYFEEFHNRREAEAMPAFSTLRRQPSGVRSAAELDHPAFFESALYREIWRPQGFHTRLEAVLRGHGGRLLGSLVLYRAPGDARFGPQDERRLAAVLPAFAAGLEAWGPAGVEDSAHVPSPEPAETLLLTLQGQLCHASPGAHRLLLMAEGGAARDNLDTPLDLLAGRLVPVLLARLRRPAGDEPALRDSPRPSVTHETAAGQFVASATLLRAMQPGGGALAQITLRRLEPHRVALERALRLLPLTPGQIAVCRGLYHGRTHLQISAQLGVTPATVVDHVRKAYQALDLRSALELRARLDACISLV